MLYHVDLWEEQQMQFGIGTVKVRDDYTTMDRIKEICCNPESLKKLKGISGIHVIKTMDGRYYINQISGYNNVIGAYCYMVHPDGKLTKEF